MAFTLWLWKLATTSSAAVLSAYANAAVTLGWLAIIWQLSMGPVMGSRADWMSAAVVPGAKFLPTTKNGPEAPLIVMLLPPSGRLFCATLPDRVFIWPFWDCKAARA